MATEHLAYPHIVNKGSIPKELIIDGKKCIPSDHCSISDDGRVTIRVNDKKSDGFVCSAGIMWSSETGWIKLNKAGIWEEYAIK